MIFVEEEGDEAVFVMTPVEEGLPECKLMPAPQTATKGAAEIPFAFTFSLLATVSKTSSENTFTTTARGDAQFSIMYVPVQYKNQVCMGNWL